MCTFTIKEKNTNEVNFHKLKLLKVFMFFLTFYKKSMNDYCISIKKNIYR